MSARSRKRAARTRDAARPARRGPPRFAVPLVALALAILIAVVAVRPHRPAPGMPPAPATLDPESAGRVAAQLTAQREWQASLPYFQRALEGEPGREWRMHFNYALVLNNVTLLFIERAGRQVPATRSSGERIQLANATLDEFTAATRLAPDGATRAKILSLRANMLALWGFPWEAFACFRAAQKADPSRPDLAARAGQYLAAIHDPTRFRFVQPDSAARLAMP